MSTILTGEDREYEVNGEEESGNKAEAFKLLPEACEAQTENYEREDCGSHVEEVKSFAKTSAHNDLGHCQDRKEGHKDLNG